MYVNNKLAIIILAGLLLSYFIYMNFRFIIVLIISLTIIMIVYYRYNKPITDILKNAASINITLKDTFTGNNLVETVQTSILCQWLGNLTSNTVPTRYEALNSTLDSLLDSLIIYLSSKSE